jgi:hypothetical protein
MFIVFPSPGAQIDTFPTQEEYLKRVKQFIGDDSLPVKILDVSKWYINEIVAESYSQGNM